MDQTEYTPECVENALMAAEVAGGRNSAVLAAEFRRIRDELAERDDQLHSAHREIVRQRIEIKRLTAPTPGRIVCGGCGRPGLLDCQCVDGPNAPGERAAS